MSFRKHRLPGTVLRKGYEWSRRRNTQSVARLRRKSTRVASRRVEARECSRIANVRGTGERRAPNGLHVSSSLSVIFLARLLHYFNVVIETYFGVKMLAAILEADGNCEAFALSGHFRFRRSRRAQGLENALCISPLAPLAVVPRHHRVSCLALRNL